MAKFSNTKRINNIDNITESFKERLDSPFNIFNTLKPYVVNYWNQNLENSTSDEASHLIHDISGEICPNRYNKISNAVMYGLQQFQIDLDVGEFGLESNSYSGESVILPNTWKPYPGDYFYINHSNSTRLFHVIGVDPDTLPNGANYYKIQFEYSTRIEKDLEDLTIERFKFILDNVGTTYSSVIRSELYDDIEQIEKKLESLKKYYNNLFFNNKVQTYVYNHNGSFFYDPYMIEFMKRNNILDFDNNHAYIAHALPIQKTFIIDYDKTFLHIVEEKDININFRLAPSGQKIDNAISLFYFTSVEYYEIKYTGTAYYTNIPVVDLELIKHIKSNDLYMDDNYKNIIIKYFNNEYPTKEDVYSISLIDLQDNIELFYNIPIIIYILERYITESISKKPKAQNSNQLTYK